MADIVKQLKARPDAARFKRRAPRRALPRQTLPVSLERAYAKFLMPIVAAYYKAYAPIIAELKDVLADEARTDHSTRYMVIDDVVHVVRADASTLPPGFKKKLEAAARKVARSIDTKRLDKFLDNHARRVDKWNNQEFSKQAKAAVGVDLLTDNPKLGAQVKSFVRTNTDLITRVGQDTKDRVAKLVRESIEKGRSYEILQRDIGAAMDIDQRRATLIARDQTSKLYGQINAERQTELGITRFTWRTAGDNRVREEHEELDGEVFEYANPPSEGLPGEAIQCRCNAEPVFDMLEGL